jgi:hypothetical protein
MQSDQALRVDPIVLQVGSTRKGRRGSSVRLGPVEVQDLLPQIVGLKSRKWALMCALESQIAPTASPRAVRHGHKAYDSLWFDRKRCRL